MGNILDPKPHSDFDSKQAGQSHGQNLVMIELFQSYWCALKKLSKFLSRGSSNVQRLLQCAFRPQFWDIVKDLQA